MSFFSAAFHAGAVQHPAEARSRDREFKILADTGGAIASLLVEGNEVDAQIKTFGILWFLTIALGVIFLIGTAREWHRLIYHEGLTISSSLFGTTFYSLVGLHAFHVLVGATGLTIILILTILGFVTRQHAERISVFAMYWHFVDAVWVVVLSVVYFITR